MENLFLLAARLLQRIKHKINEVPDGLCSPTQNQSHCLLLVCLGVESSQLPPGDVLGYQGHCRWMFVLLARIWEQQSWENTVSIPALRHREGTAALGRSNAQFAVPGR